MLTKAQRTAILELRAQKVATREIARTMKISRKRVRRVIQSNSVEVPLLNRSEEAEPFRQQILELRSRNKGNLVRVHEELQAAGADLSYPALTACCRRHGIGQEPKRVSGQYHFEPGE
jgi:transposase